MSLQDVELKNEYRSLIDNVAKDFYIPLLKEAVSYKRAVGFFSSSALVEISKGIMNLVNNGGSFQLIASPYLSDDDVDAIRKGYELREKVIENALLRELKDVKPGLEEDRLNLLAALIADGILDIRIAITEQDGGIGMYHEKMGIIADTYGNRVAFSGSMNESATAMMINYETIDVFCSWNDEQGRVISKENAFTAIWNNSEPNVTTIEFPKLKDELIKKYRKGDIIDVDKKEFGAEISSPNKEKKCWVKKPNNVKFHEYQIEAMLEWEKENFCGIFDMATGTGKTFTALGALELLSNRVDTSLAVFIVCPYQHLVEQWVEDIIKFGIKPIIGYSASSQKDWKKRLEDAVRDQKLSVRNKQFFCFITTNATFSSVFVQSQISKVRGNSLLIVDEAHNFGSENLSNLLNNNFNYRLALSATIDRHNDEEGTAKLFDYFGKKCIEYSLDRAIEEKKLTPYKYYPIIVTLNEQELQKYTELSFEIGKCVVKGKKSGSFKLSERGKRLALARARLVAGAEDKISKLEEHITAYLHDKHILVYCGATKLLENNQEFTNVDDDDLRQIDVVTNLLGNKLNMKVSQFTSKEDVEEREVLKREFSDGHSLQVLIAIKCLDEGVNIPKIKVAFILASTTNPKEYIQRRGRVLRLAEGKGYAEIFDFITLPRQLDEVHSLTEDQRKRELTLVKNELSRAEEFARIAMNMVQACVVLDEIKEAYSINNSLITFKEDYGYGE